ncbi:hypothetical protein GALMADRAFT_148508 [Galerina marginata CBS 339.88]|uniref:Peptidase S53 domain-containing protein n=1 Tax=Galerina marginata (strain CBS 339.88) TaxID=685588 RepID=A0A067S4C0_GALM3|nr:hypothetical protein GALMADRAFT_148508 [Galerina marginata CBS 339.88]
MFTSSHSALPPSTVRHSYHSRDTIVERPRSLRFIQQFANQVDLATFQRVFRPDMSNATTFTLETLEAERTHKRKARRASKLIWIFSIRLGSPQRYLLRLSPLAVISRTARWRGSRYRQYALLAQPNPPIILTTSYGENENTISRSLANGLTKIIIAGTSEPVAGTSCSSPVFVSVIALLDDKLIAAGKPPLGFLNPFLYSAAGKDALNDIATGSNPGCNINGFPAERGPQ